LSSGAAPFDASVALLAFDAIVVLLGSPVTRRGPGAADATGKAASSATRVVMSTARELESRERESFIVVPSFP